MLLPKHHLQKADVIRDLVHESQYQPAGVDLTLKSVYAFKNAGKIDFDNKERKISDVQEIEFRNDEVHLAKGAYKVIFNEYVKIPNDAAALCFPRSSLLRCGATLECAVWDPGYEGRSEALLIVANEHGLDIKKNAKIGQLIFIKLSEAAKELYEGRYKGENK
ncbi:MAG TPA: deoxyuridine 5'-triphosphate nucleotidohydrolase [Candidatus Bilamarchaeaceae archaeon]|nr:deoxyuridine 5'-triphosphate nucleotidohydrolase [Candidatus Bilamarchaeaceae archaeon]